MRLRPLFVTAFVAFSALMLIGWKALYNNWIIEKHKGYNLVYQSSDKMNASDYARLVDNGIISVGRFFGAAYTAPFEVYIHPNRHSIDSAWQADWHMPGFTSSCWMVASGVAARLDMISPETWDKEACEHHYSDPKKTQELINHELVHVYHGQLNASTDFSKAEGMDWFIEGLATYASGQCDSLRISAVRKAISERKIPHQLDSFWMGELRYGLSGSVVMFIDKRYGRIKLRSLLPFNNKADLLSELKTTEAELLNAWSVYILN